MSEDSCCRMCFDKKTVSRICCIKINSAGELGGCGKECGRVSTVQAHGDSPGSHSPECRAIIPSCKGDNLKVWGAIHPGWRPCDGRSSCEGNFWPFGKLDRGYTKLQSGD